MTDDDRISIPKGGTLAHALDLALCIDQDSTNYLTVRDLVATLRGLIAKEATS